MEETRNCPHCGVENPTSRVTCQVCHGKMSGKKEEGKTTIPEDTKPEKSKKDSGKKSLLDTTKTTNETPSKAPTATKKVVKRRKRRTQPESTKPAFFMLEEGKIVAVNVLVVIKPIKASELSDTEGSMVKFINRNRSILTG